MRRRTSPFLALAAVLALAPAASGSPAGTASGDGSTAAASGAEATAAAVSTVSVQLEQGLYDRGRHYVMRRQKVPVSGRAVGARAGTEVTVELFRNGRHLRDIETTTRSGGAFATRFTADRAARFTVRARVAASGGEPRVSSDPDTVYAIQPRARHGATGRDVRLLQRGLRRLAFVAPASGRFDGGTARGVIAFRKANKMARNATASEAVFEKLFRGAGGVTLKYPNRRGRHVEYDWSRQILILARNGRPERIYHSSSGHPRTPTVFGTFTFYRRHWGTNAKGMVHSIFFIRGYAIHGFKSVPTHPASHGCLRVPIPNARSIAQWIQLGDKISVYR